MKLKEILISKNIKQNKMAKDLGIPISTFNNYLGNHREPDYKTLILFADYLSVSVDYLLGRQQNNKIDISNLTEEQKELIPLIKKLDMLNCYRVKGYLENITNENSSEAKKLI